MDSNVRAFSLAPVTRNILGYSLFWDGILATVSKDDILAVNDTAVPRNTKKETKLGLSAFTGR